jgi:zinc transport system permease protein
MAEAAAPGLVELLGYGFLRNAVAAGLLAAVLCGVVGTFVVVRRLVFLGGGIAHAAFGGLGACYWAGIDPRIGAAAVAVVSALVLGRTEQVRGRWGDAVIGVLWAVGMAVGIVFLHATPGYAPDLMTYLFGNILTVGDADVALTAALVAVVLLLLALYFKELTALAFDPEFAAVQGVPVRAAGTTLLVVVALAVVLLIHLVGILLVIALLAIPPAISLMVVHRFGAVMLLSTVIGAAVTLGGLALSWAWDLPSGPVIVLLGAALMLAVAGGKRLARRARVPVLSSPHTSGRLSAPR